MRSARRLPSENFKVELDLGGGHRHRIHITLGYHQETGALAEISFVGRAVIGQMMDQALVDAGVALSRALQGRSPMTGDSGNPPWLFRYKLDNNDGRPVIDCSYEIVVDEGPRFSFVPIDRNPGMDRLLAEAARAVNECVAPI